MIYDSILSKSIEKIEDETACSIHKESAIKLIKKVKSECVPGMSSEEFRYLLEKCAEGLELSLNYRRVASSYIPKHRAREKEKSEAKRVQIVKKRFKVTDTQSYFTTRNDGINALHRGEN